MFDTYIAPRPRTEYVTREVHEHRAPTDDSVKLLREMEEAADKKRIASMQMPGNTFSGVVEVWGTMHDGMRHARAVFDLNGVRSTAEVSDSFYGERSELIRQLHARTAEIVASEMLLNMTKGLKF